MSSDKKSTKSKTKNPTPVEAYNAFQMLRNEQRAILSKLNEFELELNEHKIVLETLMDLDGDRKCFRMVGGVLCEKTVKDVVPVLNTRRDQLQMLIKSLHEEAVKKGTEINEYKEKHNIKIRGIDEIPSGSASGASGGGEDPSTAGKQRTNVPVSVDSI